MIIVIGLPRAFHIARDAPIGAHPYAAVAVELQGQHMCVVESALTADDVNTRQFRGIIDTHQSALGSHPHPMFAVGDGLVDFSREQSAAHRSVAEGVLRQVVAVDTASQRSNNKVATVGSDETGGRYSYRLAHGLLSFHLSLAIAIDTVFAANPHTSVSLFGKGMHIRLFRLDGNRLEPSCCAVEPHNALIVDTYPHMARTVGHQAAGKREFAPCHVPPRPASRLTGSLPESQFGFAGRPESSVVRSNGCDGACMPLLVEIVQQLEVRFPCADEVNTGIMAAHPNVAVFVLDDAARADRRQFHLDVLIMLVVFRVNHTYAAHVGSHPQEAVVHLQYVVYIIIIVLVFSCHFFESSVLGIEKSQTVFGSHPNALPVVLINLSHVVAWQTGVVAGVVLEVPDGTVVQVDDAHAVMTVTEIEMPVPVVQCAAVFVKLFDFKVCNGECATVQPFHLSVAKDKPCTVCSLCDAYNGRRGHSVFLVQNLHFPACRIINGKSKSGSY